MAPLTDTSAPARQTPATHAHTRRTEPGTPPEAAKENSPDGWKANHAVPAHLAEHRVTWHP